MLLLALISLVTLARRTERVHRKHRRQNSAKMFQGALLRAHHEDKAQKRALLWMTSSVAHGEPPRRTCWNIISFVGWLDTVGNKRFCSTKSDKESRYYHREGENALVPEQPSLSLTLDIWGILLWTKWTRIIALVGRRWSLRHFYERQLLDKEVDKQIYKLNTRPALR